MKNKKTTRPNSTLIVRLDRKSQQTLAKAAALRGVTICEYVRLVSVAQARKDVSGPDPYVISLTPAGQLEFWNALHAPFKVTPAQRKLGKLMRGETTCGGEQ